MRRTAQLAIAIVVLVLCAATLSLYSMYQRSLTSLQASKQSEVSTQDQYAQAVQQISEIQDSLAVLAPETGTLPGGNANFRAERAMNGASNGEILERIGALRAGLERGKERIAKLDASLKHSSLRVAGLQKLVAGLRRTVQEREQALAEAQTQLESTRTELATTQTQLATTQDTLTVHDGILADRTHELATVYYVQGPKSELLHSGVVEARGGVLGMGKTLRPSARIPESMLSTLDTDHETVLALNVKKAQVVSAQPLSSYALVPVDGKLELHILDAAQFRKVRQLVIVTA